MEKFEHWDECEECGFKGLMVFRTRAEEDYDDPEALGFVMDSRCPGCGSEECVLVVAEQYQEMVALRSSEPEA